MFETKNKHLIHKNAVKLVMKSLPGAVDMDSLVGYYAPYDVEWKDIKILVRVAKQSKKKSQDRAKWFYTLREKDHQIADYFILFALVDNKPTAIYAIPRVFVPSVYITITKLDGNMRYAYFRTSLKELPQTIKSVQAKLPKLIKIYKEAKTLRGGI